MTDAKLKMSYQQVLQSKFELEQIEDELTTINDEESHRARELREKKKQIDMSLQVYILEMKKEALSSNRFEIVNGVHGLLSGSNKDNLTHKMFWDYHYQNEDQPIDPSEYKFQPIDLGDDVNEEAVEYVKSLYARTIPVPSQIFKRDPCLVWCGAKDTDGYAKHKPPKEIKGSTLIHRFIYQMVAGELGEATIDHACGRVDCINLRHLRPLDRATNKAYGDPRKFMKGE